MFFLIQMLKISVIHNFATVKPKTLKLCKMIHLAALVYVISLISLKTWPNEKLPGGHICIRCISIENRIKSNRMKSNFGHVLRAIFYKLI